MEIRKMLKTEASEVRRLSRLSFDPSLERVFIETPKQAMVAVMDSKIVGGISLKTITYKDKKVGYYDIAFVSKGYQGQGIGNQLCEATTKYLIEENCTHLFALIKDDNVSSWTLFMRHGLKRVSNIQMLKSTGLPMFLLIYLITPTIFAVGLENYFCQVTEEMKERNIKKREVSEAKKQNSNAKDYLEQYDKDQHDTEYNEKKYSNIDKRSHDMQPTKKKERKDLGNNQRTSHSERKDLGKNRISNIGMTLKGITNSLCINMILFIVMGAILGKGIDAVYMGLSVGLMVLLHIVSGYFGVLSSKRKWNYRYISGGIGTCALVYLMNNCLLMVSNWYLDSYDKSMESKKNMAFVSMAQWSTLLLLTTSLYIVSPQVKVFAYLYEIGRFLLIYNIICIYPFESYGGRRVFNWNKKVYGIMAILSLVLLLISSI